MWKIRVKLETLTSDARNTIAGRKTDLELKREAAKRRIQDFRSTFRARLIKSIDKAFVGAVGVMEKAMNSFAGFLDRGLKVECSVDKENSTALRDWVQ